MISQICRRLARYAHLIARRLYVFVGEPYRGPQDHNRGRRGLVSAYRPIGGRSRTARLIRVSW